MEIIYLFILAIIAIPVCQTFLKVTNKCLDRHAALMLAEEDIIDPHIRINKAVLWLTIFIIFFIVYIKSIGIGEFIINALFLLGLLLITYIDIKYQYIFDEVTMSMAALAILATPYIQHVLIDRLLGVVVGALVMIIIAICARGMLGGGDIKLIAMLGLWNGLGGLPTTVIVGCVLAAIFALIAVATGLKKMKDTIAFGPYLALGATIYWLGIYRI